MKVFKDSGEKIEKSEVKTEEKRGGEKKKKWGEAVGAGTYKAILPTASPTELTSIGNR